MQIPRSEKTQQHFIHMLPEKAAKTQPTGVWHYERVPLNTLMPALGNISLAVYYNLRIACCAHLQVQGAATLIDCDRCRSNHGFVCPTCLGAGWLTTGNRYPFSISCGDCMYQTYDERHQPITRYDEERELDTCNRWLARHFPYGVPSTPSPDELREMSAIGSR